MSTRKNEENWQKPFWLRLLYNVVHPDHSHLAGTKNLVIEVVEDRSEIVVGKVVSGSNLDSADARHQRDKLSGKGRRIWGMLFRLKF